MTVTYRAKIKREVFSLPKLEPRQNKLTVSKFGYQMILNTD
jgi:hypothetical protein